MHRRHYADPRSSQPVAEPASQGERDFLVQWVAEEGLHILLQEQRHARLRAQRQYAALRDEKGEKVMARKSPNLSVGPKKADYGTNGGNGGYSRKTSIDDGLSKPLKLNDGKFPTTGVTKKR